MSSELVYSTDSGKNQKDGKQKKSAGNRYIKGEGPIKMRREKKGRAGKVVTVLSNIPLDEADARELLKELQGRLACGGTMKGSTLELRGDVLEKALAHVRDKGFKAVHSGG